MLGKARFYKLRHWGGRLDFLNIRGKNPAIAEQMVFGKFLSILLFDKWVNDDQQEQK